MSGSYTLRDVFNRLHPSYLLAESRGQLVDAFWGSSDLGDPHIDEFTGLPHLHHPTTGVPIDPNEHQRHPWDEEPVPDARPWWPAFLGGQQREYEELDGSAAGPRRKTVPARSVHGRRAYEDFTSAMRKINQLEPGKVAAARVRYENGLLHVEDDPECHHAANRATELGFNRYLLHRYRGAVVRKGATPAESTFSNAEGLRRSNRTIRAGTFNLLSRKIPPWRSETETSNNLVSVLFLAFTLYTQLRGVLLIGRAQTDWWRFGASLEDGVDAAIAGTARMQLVALLVLKEVYPLTYYLFWLCALLVLVVAGVLLALLSTLVLAPGLYVLDLLLGGDAQTRANNHVALKLLARALRRDPLRAFLSRTLAQQVQIWSLMGLNLSSLYRIKELLITTFVRRQLKPSIRDADHKLTSVSNLCFNLMLLYFSGEVDQGAHGKEGDFNNSRMLAVTACVSLGVLFYQMVCEKQRATDLAEALRDLNENRLSKFELALLLVKLVDDVTLEESHFNFVEHFYSNPDAQNRYRLDHVPLEPFLEGDPPNIRDSIRPAAAEAAGAGASAWAWTRWLRGEGAVHQMEQALPEDDYSLV
jgi:hypothetical protein